MTSASCRSFFGFQQIPFLGSVGWVTRGMICVLHEAVGKSELWSYKDIRPQNGVLGDIPFPFFVER